MTTRTVIDSSQSWAMRVSTPGKNVLTGGGPYLFSGELETLQIHASGIVPDIFVWENVGTPGVSRTVDITVSFAALGYIPYIEWGVTSDAVSSSMTFPGRHYNEVTSGSISDTILWLSIAMIPTTSSFRLIAVTRNSGLLNGSDARQGDLYYTVFKRATT